MKKGILGFLLLVVFLAPVSISIQEQPVKQGGYEEMLLVQSIALSAGFGNVANAKSPPIGIMDVVGGAADWLLKPAVNFIGNTALSVAAAFTWLSGELLDASLNSTVFGMGTWINSGSLGITIDTAWSLIRDICNLAFIFGFIFVGIRTILDPDHADTKRFVSRIIIGALLINFSLFFVKVIIDFSNFTAMQIYTSLTNGTGNISTTITQMLGLVTLYDIQSGDILKKLTDDNTGFWFFALGTIVLIITAFIFFAASLLLIVRFVALVLIMVFSPVLFAATVFPQTSRFASDLWSKLISYAFFAPAYLLLTLVSLTLLGGLNLRGSSFGALVTTGTAPAPGALDVILNFSIIIFFLVASLTIAQKMGVQGGAMAVSTGQKVRQSGQRFIGGATVGLAARGGRATVGRYSYNKSQDQGLKDRAAQGGVSGFMARRQLNTLRTLSNASFDARNVNGIGKKMGIGDGKSDGYAKGLEKKIKSEVEYAKGLGYDEGRVKSTKEAGEARMHQAEEVVKERKKAVAEATRPVREKLKEAIRFANDPSLRLDQREVYATEVQNLKAELDVLTAEHKDGIESAHEGVTAAKKQMEDSIKEIKGERVKAYAETSEKAADMFSIGGFDLAPSYRESAAVLRGEKDVKEMFGHIKEKAKHDDHGGGHGKDDHKADGHGKDDHGGGHGKDDHGGGHGKDDHKADGHAH